MSTLAFYGLWGVALTSRGRKTKGAEDNWVFTVECSAKLIFEPSVTTVDRGRG